MANAYVIIGGEVFPFRPTLEKGDKQTREFASASSKAVITGGLSIMMGGSPDLEAIDKAIECFLRLKKETENELFGEIIEDVTSCKFCRGSINKVTRIGDYCSIECFRDDSGITIRNYDEDTRG